MQTLTGRCSAMPRSCNRRPIPGNVSSRLGTNQTSWRPRPCRISCDAPQSWYIVGPLQLHGSRVIAPQDERPRSAKASRCQQATAAEALCTL
eukprot:7287816-Prymnesium_polylepis.2